MTISPLTYFQTLVQGRDEIPLFEASASLAQDAYPMLNLDNVQTDIDRFGAALRSRIMLDATPIQKLRALNQYFYQDLGFSVDYNHYQDPENSYLHRVIQRRRGIPVTLAILYIELAQQIDLTIEGVAFPGHFLVKMRVSSGEVVIDPQNGTSLSREELESRLEPFVTSNEIGDTLVLASHLRAAATPVILVRMLRNLKAIFTDIMNWERLLDIQQRLLMLMPNDPEETRDRGLTYLELADYPNALNDLRTYIRQRPAAQDTEQLQQLTSSLRERINQGKVD